MSNIIKYNQVQQGKSITIGVKENEALKQPFVVEEAEEVTSKIDAIIAEAKNKAQRIVEQAEQDAAIKREEMLKWCDVFEEEKRAEYLMKEENLQKHQDQIIQSLEIQKEEILKSAYEQKQFIVQQTEPEIVDMIKYLTEIVVGQCLIQNQWIEIAVKKLIYREQLASPLTVYISQAYTEEERLGIEQRFIAHGEDVKVLRKEDLSKASIEVETQFGCMQYDLNKGLEDVLEQIQALSEVQKN